MAEEIHKDKVTEEKWIKEIAERCPEVELPGYWTTLEENCKQWAIDITVSPFWRAANEHLRKWIAEYRIEFGGSLLTQEALPKFVGKGKTRIRSKLYEERKMDEEYVFKAFPENTQIIPNLNDLVRTRIDCQYMDGVEFIGNKLFDLASKFQSEPERKRKGRLEGYFAQHIVFKHDVFYRRAGNSTAARINCEIQLATTLSTQVWETTHTIYEEARGIKEKPEDWQWNPKDPRFVSRELGHMIHLADGLLVQLREAASSDKFGRSK